MSWMRSLFGGSSPPPVEAPSPQGSLLFAGDERFEFEIVGESKYQDWLEALAGPKCEEGCNKLVPVELRPEPSNLADPNAVQALVLGGVVGYVPRVPAAALAALLKAKQVPPRKAEVMGMIVGGWLRPGSEGAYGVKLDLVWPPLAFERP